MKQNFSNNNTKKSKQTEISFTYISTFYKNELQESMTVWCMLHYMHYAYIELKWKKTNHHCCCCCSFFFVTVIFHFFLFCSVHFSSLYFTFCSSVYSRFTFMLPWNEYCFFSSSFQFVLYSLPSVVLFTIFFSSFLFSSALVSDAFSVRLFSQSVYIYFIL